MSSAPGVDSTDIERGHHVRNEQFERPALALEAHVAVEPEAVLIEAEFFILFQAGDDIGGLADHQFLADLLRGILRKRRYVGFRQRLNETLLHRPLVLEPLAEIAIE